MAHLRSIVIFCLLFASCVVHAGDSPYQQQQWPWWKPTTTPPKPTTTLPPKPTTTLSPTTTLPPVTTSTAPPATPTVTTAVPQPIVTIGILIFDGIMTLDYIGVTAYLQFLTLLKYTPRFITIYNRVGVIKTSAGLPTAGTPELWADRHYSNVTEDLDILLIPGGPGRVNVLNDPMFMEFVKKKVVDTEYVLSVCTGAAILASAGHLDGRNATTNKVAYKTIAAAYPTVNWVPKARWMVDGKFWTSSGVAAGMDMANAFVGHVYGVDNAKRIADFIEIIPNFDQFNDPFAVDL